MKYGYERVTRRQFIKNHIKPITKLIIATIISLVACISCILYLLYEIGIILILKTLIPLGIAILTGCFLSQLWDKEKDILIRLKYRNYIWDIKTKKYPCYTTMDKCEIELPTYKKDCEKFQKMLDKRKKR